MHRSTARAPHRLVLASWAAVAMTVGACSSTPVSGIADGPPTDLGEVVDSRSQQAVTIEVADNIYRPRAVQVAPGTTVTFHNSGSQVHNVTPNDDVGLPTLTIAPTESASVTVPTGPGTYRFYCSLHASRDAGLQRGAFVVG